MERGKKKPSQGSAKKPTRNPTTQELLTHRITGKKLNPKKRPFVIRSYAVTKDTEKTLVDVRQTATDYIGRAVSNSAVLRAVLRYVGQQPSSWVRKELHPLIEAEIEQGRVWGKSGKP